MKVKARARIDFKAQAAIAVPKGLGFLLLQVDEEFRPRMGEQIQALAKRQSDRFAEALEKYKAIPPEQRGSTPLYAEYLIELELELTIHFRKRTVDQNALLWALYTIEANWANSSSTHQGGYWSKRLPEHIITPEMIYQDDLETYCQKDIFYMPAGAVGRFCRGAEVELGKVVERGPIGDGKSWHVTVWQTSSYLTTKEFSTWTQRVMDRIQDSGLLRTDEDEFLQIKQDFKEILEGKKRK